MKPNLSSTLPWNIPLPHGLKSRLLASYTRLDCTDAEISTIHENHLKKGFNISEFRNHNNTWHTDPIMCTGLCISITAPVSLSSCKAGRGAHREMAGAAAPAEGAADSSYLLHQSHCCLPRWLSACQLRSQQSGLVSTYLYGSYTFMQTQIVLCWLGYLFSTLYNPAWLVSKIELNWPNYICHIFRSFFELMLFFGKDECQEAPLKDILASFQVRPTVM